MCGDAGAHYKDRMMDGQTRLHRFRYRCSSGFLNKDDVVVDLGCGTGYGSQILAEKAGKVIGIDIDKENIDSCKLVYKDKNIDFRVGDMEKIKIPECDVAVAMETIEHTYSPKAVFDELKRKAKRLIIVSIPMGRTTDIDKSHHYNFLDISEVNEMVEDDDWLLFYFMNIHISCFAVYLRKSKHGL